MCETTLSSSHACGLSSRSSVCAVQQHVCSISMRWITTLTMRRLHPAPRSAPTELCADEYSHRLLPLLLPHRLYCLLVLCTPCTSPYQARYRRQSVPFSRSSVSTHDVDIILPAAICTGGRRTKHLRGKLPRFREIRAPFGT